MHIKTKSFQNQEEALNLHKEITGHDFYSSYAKKQIDAIEWFVCVDTGDIFYIYQTPEDGFSFGEKIFHKLTIHTSLSGGGFNEACFMRKSDCVLITVVAHNWDNCSKNREMFSNRKMVVTGLEGMSTEKLFELVDQLASA